MIKINGNLLLKQGWEKKGHWFILKRAIRFGWNEETGELVVGYTSLPFSVHYVYELNTILRAMRVKV